MEPSEQERAGTVPRRSAGDRRRGVSMWEDRRASSRQETRAGEDGGNDRQRACPPADNRGLVFRVRGEVGASRERLRGQQASGASCEWSAKQDED